MFYKTGDLNQPNLVIKPNGPDKHSIKLAIDEAKQEAEEKKLSDKKDVDG